MSSFARLVIFAVVVVGVYTLFSTHYVPEITPEPPPESSVAEVGGMTTVELVALGAEIFNGRGACTLCHGAPGDRAPSLDGIALAAAERIKEPGYRGNATDAAGYLRESLVDPSAYVVGGYGVTGTNDTVSPMPDVTSGEIGLTEAEVAAVVAYMESASGVDVTAAGGAEKPKESPPETPEESPEENPED